jgi:hypothetical protein
MGTYFTIGKINSNENSRVQKVRNWINCGILRNSKQISQLRLQQRHWHPHPCPPLCCRGHCCQRGWVINPNGRDGGRAGVVSGGEWGVDPPSLQPPGLGIGLGHSIVGTLGLGCLGRTSACTWWLPFFYFFIQFSVCRGRQRHNK